MMALWQDQFRNPWGGMFGGGMLIFWLAVAVVVIVGMWKVFEKAGQTGWAILIPIYNAYILLKIAGLDGGSCCISSPW
jgi:hypothetical protein